MMKLSNIAVLFTLLLPMVGYGEKNSESNSQAGTSSPQWEHLSPDKPLAKLQKEAESGDAFSQLTLGLMYITGKGVVPRDDIKGAEWIQKAAAQDNANAQYILGALYDFGQGVVHDKIRAYALFNLAAAQGFPDASSFRDELEKKLTDTERMEGRRLASNWKKGDTFEISPEEFQKRVKTALAKGQLEIGIAHLYGLGGAPKDKVKAIQLIQESADFGYATAQNFLGMLYANASPIGPEIPKDSIKALKWFQKAAAQEFAIAQYQLGNIYTAGDGVPKDDAKAAGWYLKAAAQGHAKAQLYLCGEYLNGEGLGKDAVRAYAHMRQLSA